MGVEISKLESVIEVKIDEATANLRAHDAQMKQLAQSAGQSGAAVTKAFQGTAKPIQEAGKEVQGFGARLRELLTNAKEFGGGFLSGAAAEIREHFSKTSAAATASSVEVKKATSDFGSALRQSQSVVASYSAAVLNELGKLPVVGGLFSTIGKDLENVSKFKPPKVDIEAQSFNLLAGAVRHSNQEASVGTGIIKDFKLAIGQAAAGNKTLAGTFQKLGVDIVSGLKNPAQAFGQFVKGFGNLPAVEKDAASLAVFGKTAATATPLIEGVGGALSGLEAGAAGASAALGPVGIAIGATVAVAAVAIGAVVGLGKVFIGLAQEGGDLGGKFLDLSNNTGIATEALSRYKIQAEQSGSSLEAITGAIERLERKLADAATGQEKSAKLFEILGVNAKEAAEHPQAAFDTLAVSIANIENPALRANVATTIFGRSGVNLISTFMTMRDEGAALQARMEELGIVLPRDVAAGADSVSDEFVILTGLSEQLRIKTANEMAPQMIEALHSIEGAAAEITPVIVAVGGAMATLFTNTVEGARIAVGALKGFALAVAAGQNPAGAALATGFSAGQSEGAKLRGEKLAAFNTANNKDAANALAIEEELQARVDGKKTKAQIEAARIKAELQKLLGDRNKGRSKSSGTDSVITPVDTFSSSKQLRDAELAVQESTARASIGVAKAEADEKRKILEMQYADGLVNTRAYYDQRLTLEATAIDREIAEQRRIIAVEKQRAIEAEGDTQKEIERINKLEAAKLAKAKTPKQREAIQEDKTNRILNAENQLEAERDKHLAKQIEAEGKITELQSKRSGQIASTTRDEIKANKSLEDSFSDLILEAQRATNQDYATEAKAIGEKFTDQIALAIREGRPDVIEAIKTLTGIELAKARGAEANKTETIIRAGADQEQARIQNELNQGIISEVTARRQQIAVQAKYREAIVAEMETQREAALAANDYVKAAQIAVDIDRQRGAGLEEDSNVRAIRDSLTNSFDDFEKSLVYGQKTIGEALRELARSTITSILEQVQQSIVENLTGEKTIGAALAKAISGKLAGIFKIGQTPTLPGATGEDASKLVIKNLIGNKETLSKNIEDLGNKTIEATRVAAEKQAQELAKIAQSNLEMANCACAPAQGPSLLGSILGAVVGAVGAGISGGFSGGGGGGGGGLSGLPTFDNADILPGKKDGGMVAFADAGGMCGGGHIGTEAGYAAVGKMIRGPGGPRDDKIPMWLSDGEYVTDAATVDKLGPEFFRMLPALASAGKMADGGLVAAMMSGGANAAASAPLPIPRSEARNQQQGKTISVVNHFVIQAPRGSVSAETQQQILTKAGMGMQAALARNA